MEKHFCVSVFVFNPDTKKFLFIKHRKLGKWMPPGGHMEANEDPEEAAIRETLEETGLQVKLVGERRPRDFDFIQPLAIQKDIISPEHIHIDFIYAACPLPNQTIKINLEETEGAEWFSADEIRKESFNTLEDVKQWSQKISDLWLKNEFLPLSSTNL